MNQTIAEGEPDSFNGGGSDDIYRLRRELALLSEPHRRATVLHYIHHAKKPRPNTV